MVMTNRLAFFQLRAANYNSFAGPVTVLFEINLNDFNCFLRAFLKATLLDRVLSFNGQQRASAENLRFANMAVWRHGCGYPNRSGDAHFARKLRIFRFNARLELPASSLHNGGTVLRENFR
jgi:hypothetical protein